MKTRYGRSLWKNVSSQLRIRKARHSTAIRSGMFPGATWSMTPHPIEVWLSVWMADHLETAHDRVIAMKRRQVRATTGATEPLYVAGLLYATYARPPARDRAIGTMTARIVSIVRGILASTTLGARTA